MMITSGLAATMDSQPTVVQPFRMVSMTLRPVVEPDDLGPPVCGRRMKFPYIRARDEEVNMRYSA
ncbi:hypothetical protein AB0O34_19925 [Sphaerisporangium sp. NPDC088356]|uniref:hypothetical protein n=1 Tax=Sphaerisporangium sp. NPDC088356 TaxID=3154871 RepID=UPI00341F8F24